jgi:hypothetical protein
MNLKSLLAALLAAAVCVSCGQSQPAGGQGQGKQRGDTLAGAADTTRAKSRSQQQQVELRLPEAPIDAPRATARTGDAAVTPGAPAAITPAAPAAPTRGTSAAGGADVSDVPLAPKDARWTIFCATIADDNHVETARGLKAALMKKTDMREWYILHESGQSRLYYGFYRSINEPADAAESKRAQSDRKKVEELRDGAQEQPFRDCHFVQLSSPDPESPPEWNLVNVPEDKAWTLIIGAYKDHPDRKKAAVEAVRDARARGEEAYYFHGDSVSNVCIGAWPEEAMSEERVDAREGVNTRRDPVLVLPPGMKAPGKVTNREGEDVRVVGQKVVPVDRSLIAKIEAYPHMGVNGDYLLIKGKGGKTRRHGSEVRRIPRPEESLFRDNVAQAAEEDAAAAARNPFRDDAGAAGNGVSGTAAQQPSAPSGSGQTGRLRSVGKR